MPKAWGQAVHQLWTVCGQFGHISTCTFSSIASRVHIPRLSPTLSKFCTQLSHTKNRHFTSVNREFFTSSTAPIITTTIK